MKETLEEAREGVLNLTASEETDLDVIETAMDDFERAVREDERARLAEFGAANSSPLREAAAAVLAYLEEINTHLSTDERIRLHFRWREGSTSNKAVHLFARLRETAKL